MGEAELASFINQYTVEYVRVYRHPIERVWRAITDPAEFRTWFIPGTLDPRQGGRYRFGREGDMDFAGEVVLSDPPRLIMFSGPTGPDGYFQYELSPVAGGTRMRFIQHFPPDGVYAETPDELGGEQPAGPGTPWKPAFLGGWHEFWDALGDHLDGAAPGSSLPETEFGALARAWAELGTREGGFTTKEAARHVLGLRRTERWNELNKVYRDHIAAAFPRR